MSQFDNDPHILGMRKLIEEDTAREIKEWEELAAQTDDPWHRQFRLRIAENLRSTPFPWTQKTK